MLMQIDATFIFVVISFIIFLLILKAILYHPITKVLEERSAFYSKNSKMETESKEKTKTLLEEKEQTIAKTKEEASNILKTTLNEAKNESNLKIKETKEFVKEEIQKNKDELLQEQMNAKHEIKAQMSGFVSSIVSKILNEETQIELSEEELNSRLKI